MWLDLKGPIIAGTVYVDGSLVAKDVTVTLPAVTPVTAEYKAMGTMSLPIIGQIESMELSITKIGVDLGLGKLIRLKSVTIEFRWVQDAIKGDGSSSPEGCRAYVKCVPKTLPGIGIEPGAPSENELTYEATRYQIFVGGDELWLIDRLAQIFRILGVDYYSRIQSLL